MDQQFSFFHNMCGKCCFGFILHLTFSTLNFSWNWPYLYKIILTFYLCIFMSIFKLKLLILLTDELNVLWNYGSCIRIVSLSWPFFKAHCNSETYFVIASDDVKRNCKIMTYYKHLSNKFLLHLFGLEFLSIILKFYQCIFLSLFILILLMGKMNVLWHYNNE